jgi:hypothetical protein
MAASIAASTFSALRESHDPIPRSELNMGERSGSRAQGRQSSGQKDIVK